MTRRTVLGAGVSVPPAILAARHLLREPETVMRPREHASKPGGRRAVVTGGTGATGRQIIPILLYVRTMGLKEEAVTSKGFLRTSIFRPGVLDRLEENRWIEGVMRRVVNPLSVATLAAAMVLDAEAPPLAAGAPAEEPVVYNGSGVIARMAQL
eukprot:NODE_4598_length_658_cov_228.177446.p2 GENE.NODE_4598_length_658_cov_228.177446~~NODE_4598_length_658_cov_228.177446.p2  ORF type:complete len:181 (+),score=42.70 NODE_4598_length_658_cov_228.177446:83-544(+)